jgi:hypothetical protein
MICPHCGARNAGRPQARLILTGVIFLVVAVLLLLTVRLAVVVVAAVLMGVVGVSALKAARKARNTPCRICGKRR